MYIHDARRLAASLAAGAILLVAAATPVWAQALTPADPGFWVVLPDGSRLPYDHPLAQGRGVATPTPKPAPAPVAPGRTLAPGDPGFWVTLPDGSMLPYDHPAVAGSAAAPVAPTPAAPPVSSGAVLSPGDPGFWVILPDGSMLPYDHPSAIAFRAATVPVPVPPRPASPARPAGSASTPPAPVRPSVPDTSEPEEPEPDPEPEPEPSTGSTRLKVLHWNIHHGVGTDGRYNIGRFVNWMAKWRPDVISINEAEKFTYWGREDQPKRFRDLLEAATGQQWYFHFAQEYGDWSANGKGNLILSRYPFAATGRETLSWDRTVAIATIVVNGRNVTIMSTHLDPESRARRESQARQVVSLASGWSHPQIIAGDFNAWPDQSSIDVTTRSYDDAWAEAARRGMAKSFRGNSPFGATKNGRIDYIFHSDDSPVLTLRSVQVPDTRGTSGVMPSDHRPVLAIYDVR